MGSEICVAEEKLAIREHPKEIAEKCCDDVDALTTVKA